MPVLRTGHLRRRVLEQFRAGLATGPELAAGALAGGGGTLHSELLMWLEAGMVERKREPRMGRAVPLGGHGAGASGDGGGWGVGQQRLAFGVLDAQHFHP